MISRNIILTPEEIKSFYQTSVEYSGFSSLNDEVKRLWEKLVLAGGYNPVPPGFLAKILFILTHKETGKLKETVRKREDDLIEIIRRAPAFARLEGEFIAKGFRPDSDEGYKVLEIILEKMNFFYHEKYRIYQKHLKDSFSEKMVSSEDFPAAELLGNLYEKAIDYILTNNSMLEDTDLFEIHHPQLFMGESISRLRLIYKNMVNYSHVIKKRLLSQITLRTETDTIVKNYGEPQVLMVGGYDSVTNKGNFASMLSSELAYIDENEKIDYFDYKFIQGELLYYQREEGSVFRIRRNIHLEIKISPEMEFDENISLLFAFCLAFTEKIVSVFQKDIMDVHIYLHGFMPSSIEKAVSFFEHFIKESSLHNNVFLQSHSTLHERVKNNRHIQHIIVGKTVIDSFKTIDFVFPKSEDFYGIDFERKGSLLSKVVNNIIEDTVNASYR